MNPGNSGGPAVSDGKLIGLVFSKYSSGENIGYLLATEEVKMLLKALEKGPYPGKLQLREEVATTENEALRFAAGRYLVWSDIPNNRMMRFVEPSGEVSVFRERSNNSNGNTVDNQGRLVTCEHLTRRVTRTEIDGSITVVADKWNGKRSTRPTTRWSNPTIRSGSPIRPTASTPTTRAIAPRRDRRLPVYRVDPSPATSRRDHRHGPAERPRLFA